MDFISCAKAGRGGAVVMKLEWGQRKGKEQIMSQEDEEEKQMKCM